MKVIPKKHLGQHFLHDKTICKRISDSVANKTLVEVLEIGPGMGALTSCLIQRFQNLKVIEIDNESIAYLNANNILPTTNILQGDFLNFSIEQLFNGKQFIVVGNFPYNISSQILFRVLENRQYIPELTGMFQKEVAVRIASEPGNKDYGILSVLAQAFYQVKYLFTVNEGCFNPPPKVKSGVVQLLRKDDYEHLGCEQTLFFKVVKTAFNQRRKQLHNSLKSINGTNVIFPYHSMRPEQLNYKQFVEITNAISLHE